MQSSDIPLWDRNAPGDAMIDVSDMRKALRPLKQYMDMRSCDPLTIAYEINTWPEELQEVFFEIALAYIQEVSSRNTFFTANMANYGQIARDLTG